MSSDHDRREAETRRWILSQLECLSVDEVRRRCDVGEADWPDLIQLQRGDDLVCPVFQLGLATVRMNETVRYANRAIGARDDPFGVAEWWLTDSAVLSATPLDALRTGRLTMMAVDKVVKYELS